MDAVIAPLLFVLSLAPPDSVQPAPVPVLTLPEVRVEQSRPLPDATRRQPTGFVADVRAGATGHAIETVGELVSRTAAVRIQRTGGLGAFTTLSLRGAASSQLSVYLDGVPLTSAAGSVVDLSSLPVTAIDRIEVYRGLSPLELGPVTPGGAINVITLPPTDLGRVSLVRGSFGEWEGTATAGARRGAWAALVHAGAQGSRGDFGYWDDNGTPLNPADDGMSRRDNNDFAGRTLLGTVRGELPLAVAVTLRGDAFRKSQGVPGLGNVPARATHLAFDRDLGLAELARPGFGRMPSLRLRWSVDRSRTRFEDPLGELGFGTSDRDDRFRGQLLHATAESPRLAGLATISASAQRRDEGAELADRAPGRANPPPSRRIGEGASLALKLEPWRGRLLFTAGRRWDRQHDALRWTTSLGQAGRSDLVREFDAPQLGARLRPFGPLTLKANWGRTQRSPEFVELFGDAGSVRGNPLLQPERSETWDAGGAWAVALGRAVRGSIEWAHYRQQARDLIAYARNSATSVRALNIARARLRGEELSARFELPGGVTASGWCAWQGTVDQGSIPIWRGHSLPQRPERHLFGQLGWRFRRIDVTADVEYLGEDFTDRANRMRAPSRTLAGFSAGARVFPGARIALDAKNLGDARVSDVAGFPLPGRSLYVSCEWDATSRSRP